MAREKDSIASMLWRANLGPEIIVAKPETIEKLRQKGEPISEVELPSDEDSIKKLFEERLAAALALSDKLPLCPLYEPPLVALYDEIRLCMLFGMNGTAIIWCGSLLEFVLKYVCFLKHHHTDEEFNQEGWKKHVGSMTLHNAIEKAKSEGFIKDDVF